MRIMKLMLVVLAVVLVMSAVSAAEKTKLGQSTVCCEKTKSNLFCQNIPSSECAADARQAPTSCESTSYCRQGYCFDSTEGTCSDKTSELVCNANGGVWRLEKPTQCELGCCILGDQAAFVTLTRCKKLASFLGLNTNFKGEITSEVQCIMSTKSQEKGACVYEFDLQKVCKFTTREDCSAGVEGAKGDFFVGKLCSAEELGTICGPTTKTMCVDGKEEVYFVDSCGNPANVYDSSKVNDKEYWGNVKDRTEACNPNDGNDNSASCGNCNYLLGTFCRDSKAAGGSNPRYGDNICANLNCKKTSNGKSYKHGESWCVYDDEGGLGGAAGARFYKHICINGEEVLEQCDDFKAEICLEDKIFTSEGPFAQAACRVNRWQDCTGQKSSGGCENSDQRDCNWIAGTFGVQTGFCVPKYSPGLKFWEGTEASSVCKKVNDMCEVTIVKNINGEEKEVENEWCREAAWGIAHAKACSALGDCGSKINWYGVKGGGGYDYYYTGEEGELLRDKVESNTKDFAELSTKIKVASGSTL